MGLEDRDQPLGRELAERDDRRPDLGRMVAVVVVDAGPRPFALQLQPPAHPGELGERGGGGVAVGAGEPDRRQRGAGVRQVVAARNGELQVGRARAVLVEVGDLGARGQGIEAGAGRDDEAPGGLREPLEGRPQLGDRAPVGVVVHLEVGDDRDLGPQPQEARVALVGLGDHPLPRAPARVAEAPGSSPPMKKAGSAPLARSAQAAIAAVVVFPWVPATASNRFSAQSSARSSPRWRTRRPRSRASASSGLSSAIAVETMTSAPSGRFAASWPTAGSRPAPRRRSM